MALISCSECGNQISDKALACPRCGAPNPSVTQVPQQFAYAPRAVPQPSFNPCARHPQAPAVATCGNCGSYMCKKCKDLSVYNVKNAPVCIDCTLEYNDATLTHLRTAIRWSRIKTILLSIIILFALSIWLYDPKNGSAIFTAWLVAAIGGLFSTLKQTRRSEAEKAADAIYSRFNPGEGLMYEGVGCVVRIAVAIFFAPLYTLISFIKNLIIWLTSRRNLRISEQNHAEYLELLQQCGEMG